MTCVINIDTVHILISNGKIFKNSAVRDFENNIFENEAEIELAIIVPRNLIFKNVPKVLEISINILIQELLHNMVIALKESPINS